MGGCGWGETEVREVVEGIARLSRVALKHGRRVWLWVCL